MGRRERLANQRRRDSRHRQKARSQQWHSSLDRSAEHGEWVRIPAGPGRPAGIGIDASMPGIDWAAYGLSGPQDGIPLDRCERISVDLSEPHAIRLVDVADLSVAVRERRAADAQAEGLFEDRHPREWRQAIESQGHALLLVCDLAQLRQASSTTGLRRVLAGGVAGLVGIMLHTFADGSLGYWHNSGYPDEN